MIKHKTFLTYDCAIVISAGEGSKNFAGLARERDEEFFFVMGSVLDTSHMQTRNTLQSTQTG